MKENLKVCLSLNNIILKAAEAEAEKLVQGEKREDDEFLLCQADMLRIHCCKLNQPHEPEEEKPRLQQTVDGYLIGLIAFARKFGRAILSFAILCCIILFSFQFGNATTTAISTTTAINPLEDDEDGEEEEEEQQYFRRTSSSINIPPPGAFSNEYIE